MVIPSASQGTVVSRHEFKGLLRLRYAQMPEGTPTTCICGQRNDLQHPRVCQRGTGVIGRHDKLRDILAGLVGLLGPVQVEPTLHPLEPGDALSYRSANIEDGARSDLLMEGFISPYHMLYVDVRVAARNQEAHKEESLFQMLHSQELKKRREYAQRIQMVENADFIPFILTESGLLAYQARYFIQELSTRIAAKLKSRVSAVRSCILVEISFLMQRRLLGCYLAPRGKAAIPPGLRWALSAPYAAFLLGLSHNS